MKKLTTIILSAALAAAQTAGIAANAETGVDYYAGKTVDEVYTELSGEDFVFLSDLYRYGGGCTLTLDSSGKFHIIEKNSRGTEITVAKGIELPVDEIISAATEQIKESPEKQKPTIRKNANGVTYTLKWLRSDYYEAVCDVLKGYDCVLSIDENFEAYEDRNYLSVDGFYIRSDRSPEEIVSDYPELGLEQRPYEVFDDYDYYLAISSKSWTHGQLYEALKDMSEKGIGYSALCATTELAFLNVDTINCTHNIYTKEDVTDELRTEIRQFYRRPAVQGDSNCDGGMDLADAIFIMQSLANPDKYQLTEQGRFNGDLNGDGVTSGDALSIQNRLLGIE